MTSSEGAAGGGQGSPYYEGKILRLLHGSETGVVRSATGREIVFEFRHVVMRGILRRFAELSEGMRVGFDVGWTSSGLRVTVIHAPPPESQGQPGAEQEIAAENLTDGDAEHGDIE